MIEEERPTRDILNVGPENIASNNNSSSSSSSSGRGIVDTSHDNPNSSPHKGPDDELTSHEIHIPNEDSDPPHGGLVAWTQVLLSHLINFNAFGYTSSYGIFQAYYTRELHYSASSVAWIGSINLSLIYTLGVISVPLLSRGHHRLTTLTGLLLQITGTLMTSVSTTYAPLLLAQGLCQGLGNGLLFCPAVTLTAAYFPPARRALPLACVACGGATGGLVFPALAQALLPRLGFAWTLRAMALVMLCNALPVAAFSRPRRLPSRSATTTTTSPAAPLVAALCAWRAFRERGFALYCAGVFLVFWGLWLAYYFIRPFALDMLRGTAAGDGTSFTLLLVLNGAGLPGRLLPAVLADRGGPRLGPVNVLLLSSSVAAALLFAWTAVNEIAALYVWTAGYGFAGGAVQALTLASAATFMPDGDDVGGSVGSRIALVFLVLGAASLTGPAIAGALVSSAKDSYLPAQLFAGLAMTAGSVMLVLARMAQTGRHLRRRV